MYILNKEIYEELIAYIHFTVILVHDVASKNLIPMHNEVIKQYNIGGYSVGYTDETYLRGTLLR
jgi:hypothetical protein